MTVRAIQPSRRRVGAIAAAAIAIATLSGCGSSGGSSETSAEAGSAATTPSDAVDAADAAAFNEADRAFAENMVPHHQQAVEMAVMAQDPERGASPALLDLAKRVQDAQGPEIELLTSWLTAWSATDAPSIAEMEGMEGMDHSSMDHGSMEGMDHGAMEGMDHSSMQGMMSPEQMTQLAKSTGTAFDRLWMTMMIEHHEGAIAMANAVMQDGKHPDVRALAGTIISGQEAEIEEMKEALAQ